jgi:hypothetical protein
MTVIITYENDWFNEGEIYIVSKEVEYYKIENGYRKGEYIKEKWCKEITKEKNPEYFL